MNIEKYREIPVWDQYFMTLIPFIAARSKDPNTQVGCIIVGQDNAIRSTGYNSFPRGINDNVPERLERPEKYMYIEHSERNGIYAAAKIGIPLDGCKIYQNLLPCMDCARAIIQVGIVQIIYNTFEQKKFITTSPKYAGDFDKVRQMLSEADVDIIGWDI